MEKDHLTQEEALDLDEIMKLINSPVPEDAVLQETGMEPDTTQPNPEQTPDKIPVQADKGGITLQKSILMYLHDLAYLMVAIVLVFVLFFRIVVVAGDSMYDTLVDGDYLLLLSNVFYQKPEAGDIVVISKADYDRGKPIVKRVIALEGQTVDIDFITGTVSVDGKVLEEDYIFTKTTLDEGMKFPLTVDDGCVFVLGDNRGRSKDSRNPEIGLIDHRQIVGKVIFLMVPGTDGGTVQPDYDRIGVIN